MLLGTWQHIYSLSNPNVHVTYRTLSSRVYSVCRCSFFGLQIDELACSAIGRTTATKDNDSDADERRQAKKDADDDQRKIADANYEDVDGENDCIDGGHLLPRKDDDGIDHGRK
jgi:hypothetical protein